MRLNKGFIQGLGFCLFTAIIFLFGSCKYEFVDEPTLNYNEKKNAADYKDYILPPQTVTASHGLSKIVELEWEKVPNAVQYQIYSAATPYDTFTRVSETKGDETKITIDEESGITKYYCVCAVNYYGTVSSKSVVACGSTLSVPVITQITSAQEGNAVTVNWWMDNCNSSTYQSLISYNISVYSNATSNIKFKALTATGDKRYIVVEGLAATTEYYFTVEAVHQNNKSKEISSRTNAQTAHRVIPEPAYDLTATTGDYTDKITLKWKLPPMVWYRTSEGSSGFELRPLTFKVYRKKSSEGESAYKEIQNENNTPITYTQQGDEVSFTDKNNLERGVQYDYYVKSFTGGELPAGKVISAETSETSVVKGWLLAEPKLLIKQQNVLDPDDNSKFKSISYLPQLTFETFGLAYNYTLERYKRTLEENSTYDQTLDFTKTFDSLSALNAYSDTFNSPENQKGFYKYIIKIKKDDVQILEVNPTGSQDYIVTEDAQAIPKITNFTVEDGYTNLFKLSWDYYSDYTYTLYYKDDSATVYEAVPLTTTTQNVTISDSKMNYEHKDAPNGVSRSYYLEAYKHGLKSDTEPQVYKTLGVPAPLIEVFDYTTITVKWPEVQMADETAYEVSAKYEGNSQELVDAAVQPVYDSENHIFSYTITNPAGYNDATISGKNIKLSVTAKSEKHSDQRLSSTIDVCTLGPALTATTVQSKAMTSSMSINWKNVRGAEAYKIMRTCTSTGKTDTYFYDCASNTLSVGDDNVSESRAIINYNAGTYTLLDKYCDVSDSEISYQINQSRISWGDPYNYFVLPVKNKNDVVPEYTAASIQTQTKSACTTGLGHNVKARKSDSSKKQEIEWIKPNNLNNADDYDIFYRELYTQGNTSSSWKSISSNPSVTHNGSTYTASFTPESLTGIYEYAVAYGIENVSQINLPPSFIQDNTVGLSAVEARTEYDYTGKNPEAANKGYLLAVTLKASTGDNYSEDIEWGSWEYEKRSIGPESAQLLIKNYNISADPIPVLNLDKDMHNASTLTVTNTTVTTKGQRKVNLRPAKFMMEGNNPTLITQGPLMVLRDAKHYYSLELKRGNTTCAIYDDDSVYGYRDITGYEFAKIVFLTMTQGMKQIDELDFENKSATGSNGGSVSFEHVYNWAHWETGYTYSFTDYASSIQMPSNKTDSIVKISCSGRCDRNLPGSGSYPKTFNEVTINVSGIGTNLYNGTIKFKLDSYKNAQIETSRPLASTGTNTKISLSSKDQVRMFVPFKLHGDTELYEDNSTYGWWQ